VREEREMIIFDEDAIAQRPAVICAPSEEDGPFLKRPQARDRLSRIQDGHRIFANCIAKSSRQGGDTGEVLDKIQSDSFGLQDGSPIAFDLEETISFLCPFSIMVMDGQDEGRVYGSKGLQSCRETGNDQRLLGDDAGARWCWNGKQCNGRRVAEWKIFLERQPNSAPNVGDRRFEHRLYSQHGAQLLLTAGEHDAILAQTFQSLLVIGNDFRWGLGGKFLIAELALQSQNLFGLFGLFLDDPIQRLVEINIACDRNADG
jgi:hypothetical protein